MDKEKVFKLMSKIGIGGTIVFLFIILALVMKSNDADFCGFEELSIVGTNTLIDYSVTINSSTTKIGQLLPYYNGEYVSYDLRFSLTSAGSNEIIVYSGEEPIKTFYVSNGTNNYQMFVEKISRDEIIYLSCPTCNSTNTLTPQQELLGERADIIVLENNVLEYQENTNTLYYRVYGAEDCKELIKTFFWLWIGLLLFVLLGLALSVGYEKTKEVLLEND